MSVSKDVRSFVSRDFWGRVRNVFHDLMGRPSRNVDEICSVFHDMRVKCRVYDRICNFIINNVNEDNITLVAVVMHQYKDTNHRLFTHLKVWLKFKDSSKWNV